MKVKTSRFGEREVDASRIITFTEGIPGFQECRRYFLMEHDVKSPFAWLQSLKKIDELDVDYIVPGHGEVCDKSYLVEQSNFIQEWLDTVKKGIDQGWTKEEAMSRISLLDRYPMIPWEVESLGPELQKWNVARVYDMLSR